MILIPIETFEAFNASCICAAPREITPLPPVALSKTDKVPSTFNAVFGVLPWTASYEETPTKTGVEEVPFGGFNNKPAPEVFMTRASMSLDIPTLCAYG